MSNNDLKRWAQTWESAGAALEALRRRNLAAMTDDDVRRAIADLFVDPSETDNIHERTSGLIEQQRLFLRLRSSA